jgi:hypothetical protein
LIKSEQETVSLQVFRKTALFERAIGRPRVGPAILRRPSLHFFLIGKDFIPILVTV